MTATDAAASAAARAAVPARKAADARRVSPGMGLWLFLSGGVLATALTFYTAGRGLDTAADRVMTLQKELKQKTDDLLGFTRYETYLTLGQQALSGQTRLLAASVARNEAVTQVIEKSILGLSSTGTVTVNYKVDYSFGYDLSPGAYRVVAVPGGIEVRLARPRLVARPAVSGLTYKVLSGGLFTDEDAAGRRLYEQASERALQQGAAMAADPAVMALCEKHLAAFLRDFLARQPGVRAVPAVTVAYTG